MGCMNVYVILAESGVLASGQNIKDTELFKRGKQLGLISQGAASEENPAVDNFITPENTEACELTLQVSGMWCNSCAWLIEHALKSLMGVNSAEASFATDFVKIRYRPQLVSPEHLVRRISGIGYKAKPFTPGAEREAAENRDLILRFGLAAFFWLNIMTFSLALYVGYFERISESVGQYMPFVLMALATPVVFYCGYPVHRLAWLGLRNHTLRMESLLSMGVLTAYFFSVVQAFRGASHVYFDTASVIITFVLAGKLVEHNAKQKTSRWVTLLYQMVPNKVRLLRMGENAWLV